MNLTTRRLTVRASLRVVAAAPAAAAPRTHRPSRRAAVLPPLRRAAGCAPMATPSVGECV